MRDVDLREYARLFTAYTELRWQASSSVQVTLVKGNPTANSRSSNGGISARVYVNGSWGFASSPDVSADSVKTVIAAASGNAAFLDSKERKQGRSLPSASASSENDFSTSRPRLGQRQLVDFIREIDERIAARFPRLSSRIVNLNCLDMERALVTSDGSRARSMVPRSFIRVAMSMEKDGQPVELSEAYGGLGQFEDVFTSPAALSTGIETQYERLAKKAEGVIPDAGTKTCILDAELAGILAHEAIGHTTEADLVMGGSVASQFLDKEAASPLVTLIDYASSALGKTCPVPVHVDDEGAGAKDVVIIDKGILRGYMHNKESAARFGVAPTGNARAYTFSDEPLIRMRNTAILPGSSNLADMIASVDDGYYLIKPSNGQADLTSEFMFGVMLGYEIKGGKLGRAIKDTTVSGVAFDLLKTVTMVSDEMKWLSAGMCGKKQAIPVGMGGPAIKCRVNIGGR